MEKRKLVYIGNSASSNTKHTITTIDTLSELLRKEGFEVVTASKKRQKFFRLLDMLLTVVKRRNWADIVLIDTYSTLNFYYAVAVGNLCRLFRIPYVPILHGGDLPKRLDRSKALSYKLFTGALVNATPSSYLLEAFRSRGYSNLKHLPNSIAIENYPFRERKQLEPKLLWVRAFAKIYNPLMALQVLEQLSSRYPNAQLCMVGPDKDGSMEQCKVYAQEKGLVVQFTGKLTREEWIALSAEYDVFINTTHFDNMPVSVIEAMALGLPVVSTDVGGIPHLITHGKDGLLVGDGDVGSMDEMIEELLQNLDVAHQLSRNGRRTAETFSWEHIKASWFAVFMK